MNLQSNEDSKWGLSLEDFKPEYTPVRAWSLLNFYELDGRKSVITKDNLVPIKDMPYALHSFQEGRYYLRQFRNYSIDELFLYRKSIDFRVPELSISNFRQYVSDGNIYTLFDAKQMGDMKAMLKRAYKSNFTGEGTMTYKVFIELATEIIRYEDYKELMPNVIGFKTVCNQFDTKIKALWNRAYEERNKK